MNKYGKFEYYDYPVNLDTNIEYTSAYPLQKGTDPNNIASGNVPEDYQTLEQGEYDANKPKLVYRKGNLSFISKEISDENGNFSQPPTLIINLPNYITLTGLTLLTRVPVTDGEIIAYADNVEIARNTFSSTKEQQFVEINAEKINKIEIKTNKISKPKHFAGYYQVSYGHTIVIDDEKIISNEITTNYSLKGDTIPFDTLNLDVYSPTRKAEFVQRKQKLALKNEYNSVVENFYVEQGIEKQRNTLSIMAYDEVSNLSTKYLGGMWLGTKYDPAQETSIMEIVPDIFKNTGIKISFGFEKVPPKLIGHIPICPRGKALQMAILPSGFRCNKGAVLKIEKINQKVIGTLTEKDIVAEPKPEMITDIPIRKLRLNVHRYYKSDETTEIYRYYVDSTDPVTFEFEQPLYDIKGYRVNGETLEEMPESEFKVIGGNANWVQIRNTYDGKIAIIGKQYKDYISKFEKVDETIADSELSNDVVIDLTLAPKENAECQALCDELFDIYSKTQTMRFVSLKDVKVGGVYSIKFDNQEPKNYTIIKKVNRLNGTYEVEAVQ